MLFIGTITAFSFFPSSKSLSNGKQLQQKPTINAWLPSGLSGNYFNNRDTKRYDSMRLQMSSGGIEVTMPALSSTMKEGKIVEWTVKVGDKVDSGDVMMVVESDKADMDVEAFEEGYVSSILVDEGGTASVGSVVAVLVENEADYCVYDSVYYH